MVEERGATPPGAGPNARRAARAQRILDTATELILRWGFHKVSLDDIARRAEVSKSTLYLHWRTREALLEALIDRERAALTEEVRRRIVADPGGASLHAMLRHSALALVRRPLLKAALLGDEAIVGRLATEGSRAILAARAASFAAYLEVLRAHGMVRTDMSLEAQVYVVSAVFTGFFLVAPLLPGSYRPADEALADLLAETVRRTLEPGVAQGPPAGEASGAVQRYLDHRAGASQAQADAGQGS